MRWQAEKYALAPVSTTILTPFRGASKRAVVCGRRAGRWNSPSGASASQGDSFSSFCLRIDIIVETLAQI